MRSLETKLYEAALDYGKWQKKARESKNMKDRVQFVHSETRLGMAAQAIFEREERRRDTRRGSKS
jgi:hypothetical protein